MVSGSFFFFAQSWGKYRFVFVDFVFSFKLDVFDSICLNDREEYVFKFMR